MIQQLKADMLLQRFLAPVSDESLSPIAPAPGESHTFALTGTCAYVHTHIHKLLNKINLKIE